MTQTKELSFFVEARNWRRGLRWYESQFRPAAVRGESSPLYSFHPAHPGVPERMASVVPEARLVYLVRDPVERIISSYRFQRWIAGRYDRDISELLADLEGSMTVAGSRYAFQLEQYLPFFPISQICVIDSADLRQQPSKTLRRVFRFLEVDDTFTSDAFNEQHYETEDLLAANVLGRAAKSLCYKVFGSHRGQRLRAKTPAFLQRPLLVRPEIPRVTLKPDLRAKLEAYLQPDAAKLRALTGQRFESWSV
jgi:hypothetical protein